MKIKSCDSGATRTRRLTLTNTAIKSIIPGEILHDAEVQGLQVHYRGTPAYYLYFRTKTGRERRPKIGDTAIVSLADARRIAREKLTVVAAGRDPQADIEAVAASPTVNELFDRCHRDHWAGKKTAREIRRRYDRNVRERPIGRLRVREVGFDDVKALHEALAPAPYQANRILTDLTKMFNFAERPLKWRERHTNPCSGVVYYPELKRKKFFKAEHLMRLLPILERDLVVVGSDRFAVAKRRGAAYLLFQLYTGARPEEPEVITPEHVDGDVVRLDDSKEGQRTIYCPAQAMAALRSRAWVKGRSILGRFPRKYWPKVRLEANCPDLWARDTRRTFGTAVLSTSHGAQAGELLDHKSAQTTKIYAKLLDDSARDAAAAGAARIDQLAGKTA